MWQAGGREGIASYVANGYLPPVDFAHFTVLWNAIMSSSDAELVRLAVRGNSGSVEELLARHGPVLRERFRNDIPRRWQALLTIDDLMQEAYTDAFLGIAEFNWQGEGSFQRWLGTIVRNNLLHALQMLEAEKRGGKRQPIDIQNSQESMAHLCELLTGTATSPSGQVARRENCVALERAIERLPADYRRVVQLYDLEGQAIEAVAAAFDRRPGAVYMLRARAHRALQRLLGTPSKYFSNSA